jgi:hypothetical protein
MFHVVLKLFNQNINTKKSNHNHVMSYDFYSYVSALAAAVAGHQSSSHETTHESATEDDMLHQHVKRFSGLYTGPYFDPSIATNITAQLGTHAYLPCKVKQLGNKSVSTTRSYTQLTII